MAALAISKVNKVRLASLRQIVPLIWVSNAKICRSSLISGRHILAAINVKEAECSLWNRFCGIFFFH